MTDVYETLPTAKKRGAQRPAGWVKMSAILPKRVRTVTEGYISQRLPKNNTIGMNQHYAAKFLGNPKTPPGNKDVMIDYIYAHPEKFVALCDRTEDPEVNEWARKKNGHLIEGFMKDFKQKYPRRR